VLVASRVAGCAWEMIRSGDWNPGGGSLALIATRAGKETTREMLLVPYFLLAVLSWLPQLQIFRYVPFPSFLFALIVRSNEMISASDCT